MKKLTKNTKLVQGTRIYIKGKEAKKFIKGETLFILNDEVIVDGKDRYRWVSNVGNVVKKINQKYIHIWKR